MLDKQNINCIQASFLLLVQSKMPMKHCFGVCILQYMYSVHDQVKTHHLQCMCALFWSCGLLDETSCCLCLYSQLFIKHFNEVTTVVHPHDGYTVNYSLSKAL